MFPFRKHRARRVEIRRNRPDYSETWFPRLRSMHVMMSLAIAGMFFVCATAIVTLRDDVVRHRPGEYATHDIVSRVDFKFFDRDRLMQLQQERREREPRVYQDNGDAWGSLQKRLLSLPDQLGGKRLEEVPVELRQQLELYESGALTRFAVYQTRDRKAQYEALVRDYVQKLRRFVVVPREQLEEELKRPGPEGWPVANVAPLGTMRMDGSDVQPFPLQQDLLTEIDRAADDVFLTPLPKIIAAYTKNTIKPTHVLDEEGTLEAAQRAAESVNQSAAELDLKANQPLVKRGSMVTERDSQVLRAEQRQYLQTLGPRAWGATLGLAGLVLMLTVALSGYVARYQPRCVRNHARAVALAGLLLSMLLLAQLSAIGTGSLLVFGVAPTLLVALILIIAYDQRFALAVASMHAALVTVALDQGIGFFVIIGAGVVACCFMLDAVRSRSKLVEVGGAMSLAMIAATAAAGALSYDPLAVIGRNCLHVGAAGLGVGFVALGTLPFIERAFRITTSMTLLELADASQPLLRRLCLEAPGTYSHSIQVATLAEAAAEAVGADPLLCRVGAYYHDIGKMNKADYFIENQTDGRNRHINLTPSVSLLIILGHVKDGIELAREYNLPTILFPFIQQHHGTTLVEYFYHQARQREDEDQPEVSDSQYRYPGPKPRSREVALVMIADMVESATRAMVDPTAPRIEGLVHDLIMKRLLDGQFDECPLTFRDIQAMEKTLIKTIMAVYHGRMAYPSTRAATHGAGAGADAATKTA